MTHAKDKQAEGEEDGLCSDVGEAIGTVVGGFAGPVGASLGAKLGARIGEQIDDMVEQRREPGAEEDQPARRVGASLAGAFVAPKTGNKKPAEIGRKRPDKRDGYAALLVAAYFIARA